MRLAIISDIHANIEALHAVLGHIADQNIPDIACLGDVIGYGPKVTLGSELAAGQIVELDVPITKLYLTIMEIRRRDAYSAVLDRAFAIAEHYFKNLATA